MCRYAIDGPYKEPFVCFDCRKMFKQINRWELPEAQRPKVGEERICKCPQCGKPMADIGRDFRAPKHSDIEQWQKVRILFARGFSFHSCGCCGPGFRPDELKDVWNFLESMKPLSEGERLLKSIEQKLQQRR